MSEEPPTNEATGEGSSFYAVICYACLVLMLLPLLARGTGNFVFLPSLLGALSVAFRWKSGPLLYLLTILVLAGFSLLPWDLYYYNQLFSLIGNTVGVIYVDFEDHHLALDFFYCVLLTIYVIAHYRYLSVRENVFPVDWRKKKANELATKRKKRPLYLKPVRSPALIHAQEGIWLAAFGLLTGLFAQLLWVWLDDRTTYDSLFLFRGFSLYLEIDRRPWQLLILLWNGIVLVLIATSVLAWLGFQRMTREEALLLLQDQLWRETRREQSRIHRWLTWGNKKRAWR